MQTITLAHKLYTVHFCDVCMRTSRYVYIYFLCGGLTLLNFFLISLLVIFQRKKSMYLIKYNLCSVTQFCQMNKLRFEFILLLHLISEHMRVSWVAAKLFLFGQLTSTVGYQKKKCCKSNFVTTFIIGVDHCTCKQFISF